MTVAVECRACRAGLPLVWNEQYRKQMHLGPQREVQSCPFVDARERRARDIANDRGNENFRGR